LARKQPSPAQFCMSLNDPKATSMPTSLAPLFFG
jgi:hypothetical protein